MTTTKLPPAPFHHLSLPECKAMKFGKGNSVEVLRRDHGFCGSWFPAHIISLDGDNYIVKYRLLLNHEGKQVVEKMHEKDIRPQPPNVKGKTWRVGDIAEVFDTNCWRVGKVAKVLKKHNQFVIRFFGSIQLKEFYESNLRTRQAWCDNEWKVTGKVAYDRQFPNNFMPNNSEFAGDLLPRNASKVQCNYSCLREYPKGYLKGGTDHVQMCPLVRTMNKGQAYQFEDCSKDLLIGRSHKKRKLLPCPRRCDETPNRILPLFKQVDNISCPDVGADEKFIKERTKLDIRLVKAIPHCLHDSSRPLWSGEDSDQCSVGSCSFNDVADYPSHILHKSLVNMPDSSDAESSFPSPCSKRNLSMSPVNKLEMDIHELELRAYKSTMMALYALGPLSWEQESLLTNLRLSLNISDEEHRLHLRHLLST